jgi:hypothetical protein
MVGALALGLLSGIGMTSWAFGHGGGHGGHGSAPRAQAYRPPRMPHPAPAHSNVSGNRAATPHTQGRSNNGQAHANAAVAHNNRSSARTAGTTGRGNRNQAQSLASTTGATTTTGGTNPTGVNRATRAAVQSQGTLASSSSPYRYTYGTGSGARAYRAYGYGSGYRNRYYGAGYGYGRSQALNRGIVARLRSVHASLAQVNQNYQGHRVQAMRSIQTAIRQLSHRSMMYNTGGLASGTNNGLGMGLGMGNVRGVGNVQGVRRTGLGGGAGVGGGQPMTQAQSDARMSQALRNLQGISMQLGNQGYNSMGHAGAQGHIHQAIRHLNVALSIR